MATLMELVPAEYSFVLHTANPVTGNQSEVYGEICVDLAKPWSETSQETRSLLRRRSRVSPTMFARSVQPRRARGTGEHAHDHREVRQQRRGPRGFRPAPDSTTRSSSGRTRARRWRTQTSR